MPRSTINWQGTSRNTWVYSPPFFAFPDKTPTVPNSPLSPILPARPGDNLQWGNLPGASSSLALAGLIRKHPGPVLVVAPDVQSAERLESELGFFLSNPALPVFGFPDWETLPYDVFSPLPELISQRLTCLHRLAGLRRGALVVPVGTLMQRVSPRDFLDSRTLVMDRGDRLDLESIRQRLGHAGYNCVAQVLAHGEFAVRGSLFDIFPMGTDRPYRIDLFDNEIESIRFFDPESQRSGDKVERIRIYPAREFPTDAEAIARFRQAWRNHMEGDPQSSLVYQGVSEGHLPGGVENYLPLFFERLETLFDYLPGDFVTVSFAETRERAEAFQADLLHRHEQLRHDIQRPLLPPSALYLDVDELVSRLRSHTQIEIQGSELTERRKGFAGFRNHGVRPLPALTLNARAADPAAALRAFLPSTALRTGAPDSVEGRVLFIAEGPGRREQLLETLQGFGIKPRPFEGWQAFLEADAPLGLTVSPIEQGFILEDPPLAVVPEEALLGERVRQSRRRRKTAERDAELIVRNLTELNIGAPVVHEEHGVGRYLGLQTLSPVLSTVEGAGGSLNEFLTLEYANGDKLYVPVASLHLISRYTGVSPENAPLHKLGSGQWEKARRKAAEKAHDVAVELLDIYARREANPGFAFPAAAEEYNAFAAAFPFEETPDQQSAIDAVLADMANPRPMDRVICGDVGFGKTEVAMRAAFMAAHGGRQVAILAPTTLLVQQHFENFSDRFADWPVRVESLSRFRTAKQQTEVLKGLAEGTVDIVVGTHKLLGSDIHFKQLGLAIIDEEHRFGVRHKERLKSLRSSLDILTLTATPIPRTLNMAMSGMRDLSIIATPPASRHPIKTFVSQWSDDLIVEACRRELRRGGQIYFLHNEVDSIAAMTERLGRLLPEARVEFAHGQMRESSLEQIMRDFYHQRFNLLVSTTIIESGIDVPTANTIVINRADKLGLAQLHQLRGRVGRSHHRAYAYLLTPPPQAMSDDARKRLEAIEALEELGAGFTLATHDLEIRGAGELLGDEQSGQIQEIGFSLYTELLERAVKALKSGQQPDLLRPLHQGAEVDLGMPALLPEDYLPDVHMRLVQYKRIAGAKDEAALRELQVEMIDRFGLLPPPARNLFDTTRLRLRAQAIGIKKLEAHAKGGRILFNDKPDIDPVRLIQMIQTKPQQFKLDGPDKLRFFAKLEEPEKRA
ncbi:MAG: transcription-repair coupling factor, partial [Gammaproteobacteria bacterium]|nr:transcription-repair coupling factor [Gammaproteobacteria bacterium]MBU1653617.1 transcription-repair coupling factor [Gammaproteobacteria bacterium]MBU1962693.1 transcription-repair coupling factor [Gammaproteobacteria bacterium]